MERKGAAYSIKAKRPAGSHAEHTQVTQVSSWAAAMNARDREYQRARSGAMSEEEAGRVDIVLDRLNRGVKTPKEYLEGY